MSALILDKQRWQAVVARDAGAEGFVYAVSTTGIYCRPGCASRRPNRANVVFFGTAAEAKRAGFRPCRRCQPDQVAPCNAAPDVVVNACRLMDEAEGPLSLAELSFALNVSPYHFHKVFKATMDMTPKQYAVSGRHLRLRDRLSYPPSVTAAIFDAGYNSLSRAYSETNEVLGMTPKRYSSGGIGETIGYSVTKSSLGRALIAATERGVCCIIFGESRLALEKELRKRFPNASIERSDKVARWAAPVIAAIDYAKVPHGLPLDIRGTAFQKKVWDALGQIRPGATETYSEVAQRIGRPKAVRAVAGACAANNLGVVVPCHRVIRSDGGLGGYRWGIKRKKTLLAREAATKNNPS